jgi:thymidylate synthase (FAD)
MKIKVSHVQHCGNDLTSVNAARISFANNSQQLTDKDVKLINYLADNEHMSPFEHNSITFLLEVPLFIRSHIMRHRTFSYNEVSRRYSSDDIDFYYPEEFNKQSKSNKQCSEGTLDERDQILARMKFDRAVSNCLTTYNYMIEKGVSKEQARMILPQNLMTKFYMTGNLRNFVHFVKLRDHHHAQKEAQFVAKEMRKSLEQIFPESTKALFKEKK